MSSRLHIDRLRHVVPYRATLDALRERMLDRLGPGLGSESWERALRLYEDYLIDLPYTGGPFCLQAHALYDSLMCFAYWEAMPEDRRETVNEFADTVAIVFNGSPMRGEPPEQRLPRIVADHSTPLIKVIGVGVRALSAYQNLRVRSGAWHNMWEFRFNAHKPDNCPLEVELVGCPVADFAQKRGLGHLMPAMCNPDFESPLRGMGIGLARPTTVGMGYPTCDMYYYGVDSPEASAPELEPRLREDGFLANDVPPAGTPKVDAKLPLTWAYFNLMAPVLRHYLQRRFGYELAKRAYDGARPVYRRLIDAAPRIGAGNPMASDIYMACVIFAMWEAAGGEVTPDMMRAAIRDLFATRLVAVAGRAMDLRKSGAARKMTERLRANAAWAEARPSVAGASWDFNFDDDRDGTVVHYHFTRCPLNDLAREQGLMEILPVACEIDYLTCELMHAKLTRGHTLGSGGPVCDYLIEPVS